ncbi:MAG: hypothetical protein MJ162_01490 [Treponema sp.]|nr:hypothetical protein [Treponema sp.]
MKENLEKVKKAYDITGEDFYLTAAEKNAELSYDKSTPHRKWNIMS